MAMVHLRTAIVQTQVTVSDLRVTYETYDVLSNPCVTAEADKNNILAEAGLPSTLTWTSCTVVSHTLVGGRNRYLLDVVVTG